MSLLARFMYGALVWKERRRARVPRRQPADESADSAAHLITGRRGETLAYWYLRRRGYVVVARNEPSRGAGGELDIVAWDGPVLAFVEVKSRLTPAQVPPEDAVTPGQRQRIVQAAEAYLRRLPWRPAGYRFDVVSVSWEPRSGCQVRLVKDAFRG